MPSWLSLHSSYDTAVAETKAIACIADTAAGKRAVLCFGWPRFGDALLIAFQDDQRLPYLHVLHHLAAQADQIEECVPESFASFYPRCLPPFLVFPDEQSTPPVY